MIADGNRDIETCGFSDILFAIKLPQVITLVEDKYNCEAISLAIRRIKLPSVP